MTHAEPVKSLAVLRTGPLVVIAALVPLNDADELPVQVTPPDRVPVCCAPDESAAASPLVSLSLHHPVGELVVMLFSMVCEVIRTIRS